MASTQPAAVHGLEQRALAALVVRSLCALALGLPTAGCHILVETPYEASAAYASSPIRALQVGTFRGEAKYETTPSRIERNGGESYELPVMVSTFLRQAFLAEINRRWIGIARDGKWVDGQLIEFDFPWVEQTYSPDRARCFMRFRFTVRERDRTVFEKTYEQSLELGVVRKTLWGKPQSRDVGGAFVQLLKRLFGAFLEDCPVVALLSPSTDPNPGCQWTRKPTGW